MFADAELEKGGERGKEEKGWEKGGIYTQRLQFAVD
jgi:hypothetical protein